MFGWILSALYVVALSYLLDLLSKTMSWYGAPWFIFGLYVVPTFGVSGFLTSLVNNRVTINFGNGIDFQHTTFIKTYFFSRIIPTVHFQ